jgi:hypothetical protein
MLTGKTFRLRRRVLAMATERYGKRVAAWIPAGETFRVLSGPWPDGPRLVDIVWQKRTFEIFAVDIEQRCVEVISGAVLRWTRRGT